MSPVPRKIDEAWVLAVLVAVLVVVRVLVDVFELELPSSSYRPLADASWITPWRTCLDWLRFLFE